MFGKNRAGSGCRLLGRHVHVHLDLQHLRLEVKVLVKQVLVTEVQFRKLKGQD